MGWLKLLAWGLPFLWLPRTLDPFLLPKDVLFGVGSLLFLITTVFDTPRPLATWHNPWTKWFLGWVVVNSSWLFWKPFLFRKSEQVVVHTETLLPCLTALWACLLVWGLVCYVCPVHRRAVLLTQWLCGAAFVTAGYALLQFCGIDQFFGSWRTYLTDAQTGLRGMPALPWQAHSMKGVLGSVAYVAAYLAMVCPLFLAFRARKYLWALAVLLVVIVLSQARYAQLAVIVSLLTYGGLRLYHRFPRWRWWRVSVLIVAGSVVLAGVFYGYTLWTWFLREERAGVWLEAAKQWQLFNFTGVGLGNFDTLFGYHWEEVRQRIPEALRTGARWRWAHNDLLQGFHEIGMFGMVPLLLMVGHAARRAWRKTSTPFGSAYFAAGVATAIVSLFLFPWHLAVTCFVGCVIWAMWEAPEPQGDGA